MSLYNAIKNMLSCGMRGNPGGLRHQSRSRSPMPSEARNPGRISTRSCQIQFHHSPAGFRNHRQRHRRFCQKTIANANGTLDEIGRLPPAEVNFNNTVRALDDIDYGISLTENRLEIIKQTSIDAALRDAATDQIKVIHEWSVEAWIIGRTFIALSRLTRTQPQLAGEDAKLFKETMRDYTRAGLNFPKAQRDEVEALRKKLSGLTTDFETHVTEAEQKMTFTKAQMDGVPEDFLSQKEVANADGTYSIMVNITWHYLTVMENAKDENVRLQVQTARDNLAKAANVPILQQILVLRDTLAHKLGYKSWADYAVEIKMAKTATPRRIFGKIESRFAAEV